MSKSKDQKVYMPLMVGDWYSPNTYSENFKPIPETSGVYYFDNLEGEVLYVGSAKNLRTRYKGHEVKRLLNRVFRYVYFHFMETADYKHVEVSLIKSLRPKYNFQHNG